MGLSISHDEELPVPFTHKSCKIKGLQSLRGPTDRDYFVIVDEEEDYGPQPSPIKFRYNTKSIDDWQWEWTVHPDDSVWYSVKEEYYQIPQSDLKKFPFTVIVEDTSRIIRVELPIIHKQLSNDSAHSNDEDEDEEDETDDNEDQKDDAKLDIASPPSTWSQYSCDPRIPQLQIPLPAKYNVIRQILSAKDPIPPHVLNKYHLLKQDMYAVVLESGLVNSKRLKCRFASKDLGSGGGIGAKVQKHPVLMFFEEEPEKPDDVVWVLHLVKDTRIGQASVEFDPKCWNKFNPQKGWSVSEQIVELQDITLADIAKWCVKYEERNPDYTEAYNNCRKFMLELSYFINVQFDDILLLEKVWYAMPVDRSGKPYQCYSG